MDPFSFVNLPEVLGGHLIWLFVPVLVATAALGLSAGARKSGKRGKAKNRSNNAILASTPFKVGPILNRSEGQVFNAIDAILRDARGGPRVLAQVAMGEVLRAQPSDGRRSDRQVAFNMINAKRFDFVVVDANWRPVVVLEYHGRGHHQGDASKRDEIKRIACKAAGLPLIELSGSGLDPDHIRQIKHLLGIPTQVAAE